MREKLCKAFSVLIFPSKIDMFNSCAALHDVIVAICSDVFSCLMLIDIILLPILDSSVMFALLVYFYLEGI